jgi:hypothetical protein
MRPEIRPHLRLRRRACLPRGEILGVSLSMALSVGLLSVGRRVAGRLPTWLAVLGTVSAAMLAALAATAFGAPEFMPVSACGPHRGPLTQVARNSYSAAFRSHTGRWEQIPLSGDLKHSADALATLLAPYLEH